MRSEVDYKGILNRIYQKHNPAKTGEIDQLLEKYRGRESDLLDAIKSKYQISQREFEALVLGRQGTSTKTGLIVCLSIVLLLVGVLIWHFASRCVESKRTIDAVVPNQTVVNPQTDSINKVEIPAVVPNQRKAMLDAVRLSVEKELRQKVKFVVRSVDSCDQVFLFSLRPVQEDGSPVDYRRTEYQRFIDDGTFDEGVLALLEISNGRWIVLEYSIGSTDFPVGEWLEKHNLKQCRKSFGFTS
jgi:hypothetical protein